MIVQTAPLGAKHFAITMAEHTELAGMYARAFGNNEFEPVAPRDLMFYVVDHHDQGWSSLDAAPGTDLRTGLPVNQVDTPLEDIANPSTASPELNERHHVFCGLLSSIHSGGLYNGRYGLSDKVLIDAIPASDRPLVARMLDEEMVRQSRLNARLAANPETANWVEQGRLFQNYMQMRFFDTLALDFDRIHKSDRGETRVATGHDHARRDATITLRPAGDATYALSPFPFTRDPVEFQYSGRYIEPAMRSGTMGRHIMVYFAAMADGQVAVGIDVPDHTRVPRGSG